MKTTQHAHIASHEEHLGGAYPSAIHRKGRQGETGLSLASANAAMNGISLKSYCRDFDIGYQDLLNGQSSAVRKLARLTETPVDALLWHTPRNHADGTVSLCGTNLPEGMLTKGGLQICPVCLLQDESIGGPNARRIRSHWHLAALRRCHVHNVLFETITINGRSSDAQEGLQAWLPSDIAPAIDGHKALEDHILGHLSGTRHRPLDTPLHVVIAFSEALGALQMDLRPSVVVRPDPNDLIKAGAAGFSILSQGDGAIVEAMRVATASARETSKYGSILQPVLRCLHASQKDPAFDGFRSLVRKFICDNFYIPESTSLLGEKTGQSRVYTASKASHETGFSISLINRELIKRNIRDKKSPNNRSSRQLVVSRELMDEIVTTIGGLSNITVTRHFLGLERFVMEQLEDSGILPSHFGSDGGLPMYHFQIVETYLQNLQDRSERSACIGPCWISLHDAARTFACPTSWLINGALSGTLSLTKVAKNCFHSRDFYLLRDEIQSRLQDSPPPDVSLPDAARMLGLTTTLLRDLIAVGALEKAARNGAPEPYIPSGEVERFDRDYVFLRGLNGPRQAQFVELRAHLQKSGCPPLQGPRGATAHYPRRHILQLAQRPEGDALTRILMAENLGPRRSQSVRVNYGHRSESAA
ncbi:TniQ family protein [Thioclava kandeliae]|uniref:TniQ family protein n=1 Tax=Thioclava kandeliae TaxID=3070818 RepID=A0ABV1SIT0_9RHOB